MKVLICIFFLLVFSIELYAYGDSEDYDSSTEYNSSVAIDLSPLLPYSELQCYRFNKDAFNETLDNPQDIIVSYVMTQFDPEPLSTFLNFKFAHSKHISSVDIQCDLPNDENHTSPSECYGYDHEKIHYYVNHNTLYLKAEYIPFPSFNTSKKYSIHAKDPLFLKGLPVACHPEETHIQIADITQGSVQEKYAQTINIADAIIYQLDYNGSLIMAAGEDNSPYSRGIKCQNGRHLQHEIVLRSLNGGKSWEKPHIEALCAMVKKLIVIDETHVVILTENAVLSSWDAGNSWKEKYIDEDTTSLRKYGNILRLTTSTGNVFESKDKGKTWHHIIERIDTEETQ